jgi:deoxyribonucleoside regulator
MNLRHEKMSIGQRDLIKICYLYYKEGKTQEEISSIYSLSRFKIIRLLKEARDQGLVTIHINAPMENLGETEVKLARKFGIQEAIVVRFNEFSGQSMIEQIGEAGAQYVAGVIHGYKVLGVAWGRTLYHLVKDVKPLDVKDLIVVQISGGLGTIEGTDTSILTMTLSQKLGGTPYILQAPVIVRNRAIRDSLLKEKKIRETLTTAKTAEIALLGIGTCNPEGGLWRAGLLDEKVRIKLKKTGAVGAICGRFYNIDGERCSNDLDDRIIGITLDELRRIKHKVGVALGQEKVDAILGALKGKLLDVLITDEKTAERLLERS